MKQKLMISLIAVAATAMTGCATTTRSADPANMSTERIYSTLVEVAHSIDLNQRILAEAKNTQVMVDAVAAQSPAARNKIEHLTTNKIPYGMDERISLEWSGPIEEIVDVLVDGTQKYTFLPEGKRPPTPILVRVSARDRQIGEILRDVGVQAGARADIIVDENTMLVKLKYNM